LFITSPGRTDGLLVVMAVILLGAVVMFGVVFFRLHTLPERIAHKSQKVQFEIVAILGLISLFTHMHIFWIAGLLLAVIDMPDFGFSLNRIAGSAEKIAGLGPGQGAMEIPQARPVEHPSAESPSGQLPPPPGAGNGGAAAPVRPDVDSPVSRSKSHA
jgi:hypothetical protein